MAVNIRVLTDDEMSAHRCLPEEIEAYARHLGIDVEHDRDLFWIAEQGLLAVPPVPWKACQRRGSTEIFFYNFETGEPKWEHPCDESFREQVAQELKRRVLVPVTLAPKRLPNGAWAIHGTNLAGQEVCSAAVAFGGAETFEGMADFLRAQLALPQGSVARFVLPDATVLARSHCHKMVKQLFLLMD